MVLKNYCDKEDRTILIGWDQQRPTPILQRRHIDGKEVHEKMLNITNY